MVFEPNDRSEQERISETLVEVKQERPERSRAAIIALMAAPGHKRASGSSRIIG